MEVRIQCCGIGFQNELRKGGVDIGRILHDPEKASIHSMVQHLNWATENDPDFTKREAETWKRELKDEMKEAGLD